MRVLQLTSHLDVGGITTHVLTVAQALARRGHDVVVASDGGARLPELASQGIAHWPVPFHTKAEFSPHVFLGVQQLDRHLPAHPIELIHAHTRVAQVAGAWLAHRHRVPYVTTWHGFYRRRLTRRWWPCTGDVTIAISEPVARHLREVFRVPPERIRLLPHGVDVERFDQPMNPSMRQALRVEAGLDPNRPVVGTMSRLIPDRDVAVLIHAFREVRQRMPDAQLAISGDGPERAKLEALVTSLGLSTSVKFVGTRPDSRATLALMDVFVFVPSTQEGFGLSLLEAMASGLPVVAIQQGPGSAWMMEGLREALVSVEPAQPRALSEALLAYLQRPEEARRRGEAGKALVRARHNVTDYITQLEAVYADVLARRASA